MTCSPECKNKHECGRCVFHCCERYQAKAIWDRLKARGTSSSINEVFFDTLCLSCDTYMFWGVLVWIPSLTDRNQTAGWRWCPGSDGETLMQCSLFLWILQPAKNAKPDVNLSGQGSQQKPTGGSCCSWSFRIQSWERFGEWLCDLESEWQKAMGLFYQRTSPFYQCLRKWLWVRCIEVALRTGSAGHNRASVVACALLIALNRCANYFPFVF